MEEGLRSKWAKALVFSIRQLHGRLVGYAHVMNPVSAASKPVVWLSPETRSSS